MSLSFAYGIDPSVEHAKALLHKALDLGYNHLDTARLYGLGKSETVIGETLKSMRNKFYLASKAGIIADGPKRGLDGSPAALKAACETSLKLLQTDFIDLYYLHRLDNKVPVEESVGALAELMAEGKIGGIGLSEVSASTIRKAHAAAPITAVQNEYSLWTRNPELGVSDACAELGITLVAFSPVGRGALANAIGSNTSLAKDDFRIDMPRFLPENWPHNRALLDEFIAIAAEQKVTPAQLSLAWVLSRGEHIVAIPGTQNLNHLAENIATWQWQPGKEVLQRIDQLINQKTVAGHRYSQMMRASIDTEEFA